jgi:glucose/arabinose dehydrogenase
MTHPHHTGLVALAAAAALGLAAVAWWRPGPWPSRRGSPVWGNPDLPPPQRGLLPTMKIAEPAPWGGRTPVVPEGWTVSAIAQDLQIPRQTLVLPNGDILVAEGRGGGAPALRPKDLIAGVIKARGNTAVRSGNRLTLLRDADGDGKYEGRWVFAENLNAPYGLALVGNRLYVANQDALVRFDYTPARPVPPRRRCA